MASLYGIKRAIKIDLNWPVKLSLVPLLLYGVWQLGQQGATPYIYFNYNVPIVTNTTLTRLVAILNTAEVLSGPLISVFPNPTHENQVTVKSTSIIQEIVLFDLQGRALVSQPAGSGQCQG